MQISPGWPRVNSSTLGDVPIWRIDGPAGTGRVAEREDGMSLTSINPANGQVLERFEETSPAEVERILSTYSREIKGTERDILFRKHKEEVARKRGYIL